MTIFLKKLVHYSKLDFDKTVNTKALMKTVVTVKDYETSFSKSGWAWFLNLFCVFANSNKMKAEVMK